MVGRVIKDARRTANGAVVMGLSGALFVFGLAMTGAMLACNAVLGGAELSESSYRPSSAPREASDSAI